MTHQKNSFNSRHYVPVLRGKAAEFDALDNLPETLKDRMTPLIEIPSKKFNPDDPQTPGRVDLEFRKCIARIASSRGERQVFLDLQHLDPLVRGLNNLHPVEVMWREAELVCLFPPTPTPVVALDSPLDYRVAVRDVLANADASFVGLCLRLKNQHLLYPNSQGAVDDFLEFFSLEPESVDLVFDFEMVGKSGFNLGALCAALPYLQRWRTFTTIGGAFPVDLREFDVGEHNHPRWEWRRYFQQVAQGSSLARRPAFGDYTIQHPIYIEPVDGARPSASVRYTCEQDTLIMRGESLAKDGGAGHKQYPAHAVMLCSRNEFYGQHYSYGDKYIFEIAEKFEELMQREKGGTGGPQEWIAAGINHHLTVVTHQVFVLP